MPALFFSRDAKIYSYGKNKEQKEGEIMGSWGYGSCSSDSVWDFLLAKDINKMRQAEANASLCNVWEEDNCDFERLGVVIWVLRQGLWISKSMLKLALAYANAELHPDRLKDWKDKKKRKEALVIEMNEIRAAETKMGYGMKKHTDGLIEEMEKASVSETAINDIWLLRLHEGEEFKDMRVSSDYKKLKKYVRKLTKGKVVFHKRGNLFFVNADNTEIGVIAKVEVLGNNT